MTLTATASRSRGPVARAWKGPGLLTTARGPATSAPFYTREATTTMNITPKRQRAAQHPVPAWEIRQIEEAGRFYLMRDALREMGVTATAEELRVLRWLAMCGEDKATAVAGLIRRTREASATALVGA